MTITEITVVQGIALQIGPKGEKGDPGPPGSIQSLDLMRGWTTLQYAVPTSLVYVPGGTTVWDTQANPNARLVVTSDNTTMGSPVNVVEGAYYALRIVQSSPPRTFSWHTNYHWPGGAAAAVPPSNTANAIDLFHFRGGVGNVLEFTGAQFNIKA